MTSKLGIEEMDGRFRKNISELVSRTSYLEQEPTLLKS